MHNAEGNKATVDAFAQNFSRDQTVSFEATYTTTGSSPATIVYAVNPSSNEVAFRSTTTASDGANVWAFANSSGAYVCNQSSPAEGWSCSKGSLRSAEVGKLADIYTPSHWINFLKGFSLVAGLTGDKVTSSTMSLNGFDMDCVDVVAKGVPGTSTICSTSRGSWATSRWRRIRRASRSRTTRPRPTQRSSSFPGRDRHFDHDVTRRGIRVGLEVGKTWVFASALDWPGWCRRGKGEDAALAILMDYTDRYAALAGTEFRGGTPQLVGRVPGDATTDFGAPGVVGPWDDEPWSGAEAAPPGRPAARLLARPSTLRFRLRLLRSRKAPVEGTRP